MVASQLVDMFLHMRQPRESYFGRAVVKNVLPKSLILPVSYLLPVLHTVLMPEFRLPRARGNLHYHHRWHQRSRERIDHSICSHIELTGCGICWFYSPWRYCIGGYPFRDDICIECFEIAVGKDTLWRYIAHHLAFALHNTQSILSQSCNREFRKQAIISKVSHLQVEMFSHFKKFSH